MSDNEGYKEFYKIQKEEEIKTEKLITKVNETLESIIIIEPDLENVIAELKDDITYVNNTEDLYYIIKTLGLVIKSYMIGVNTKRLVLKNLTEIIESTYSNFNIDF